MMSSLEVPIKRLRWSSIQTLLTLTPLLLLNVLLPRSWHNPMASPSWIFWLSLRRSRMLVKQLFSFLQNKLMPHAGLSFFPLLLNVLVVGQVIWRSKQIISSTLQLKSDFAINILDDWHLLFRFNNEADFLLVRLKKSIYVKGNLFWFLKWSPLFKVGI